MIDSSDIEQILPNIYRMCQYRKNKGQFARWETEDVVNSIVYYTLKNGHLFKPEKGSLVAFSRWQFSKVWDEYAAFELNMKRDPKTGKMHYRDFSVITTSFPDPEDNSDEIHSEALMSSSTPFDILAWDDEVKVVLKKVDDVVNTRLRSSQSLHERRLRVWNAYKTAGIDAAAEVTGCRAKALEIIKNIRIKIGEHGVRDPRLG